MIRILCAFLLSTPALVSAAPGILMSGGPGPILQPKQYPAPSGEYVLDVNPSSRDGAGPGEYRLTRGGEVVWAKEFPVTLWQAEVSDRGYVGGYAYSSGCDDYSEKSHFHVLVFSPTGEVILDQATKRTPPRSLFSAPDPCGAGVLTSDVLDRLVVRVVNSEPYGDPIWKAFRLSTGETLADVVPQEPELSGPKDRIYLSGAQAVPGTPLTLVWWWYSAHSIPLGFGRWASGGVYSLLDPDGRMVWSLERKCDYSVPDNGKEQYRLERDVRVVGPILDVSPGGRLVLWFVEDEQRVGFTVTQRDDAPGWKVERDEGVDFIPAILEEPVPPPKIELRHIDTVDLEPATEALHSPGMGYIDRHGRILVMDGAVAVHAFDREGRSLFVGRPEPGELRVSTLGCLAVNREGDVFVPHDNRYDEPCLYLHFDDEGRRIGKVDLGSRRVVFDPQGSTRWVEEIYYELRMVGAEGKCLAVAERRSDRRWFRDVNDFDVTRSGSLVLADTPRSGTLDRGNALVICDPSGNPRRTIELPMVLGVSRLRASERWIVAGESSSEQFLVRVEDGAIFWFDPLRGVESSNSWRFGFSPDERELWGVEAAALKLHRYALPD